MLTIRNPATEDVLQRLPGDDEATVARKCATARAAQPDWLARSLDERLAMVRRFGALLAERRERLAGLLTAEMGKPIRQSRNEIDAMQGRIAFFLEHTRGALGAEVVHQTVGPPPLTERITHDPLGVIANISAWNYPYFVGSNVFLPALLTGNAVLYKPSEHATLTGLAIAELLHAAGVPEDVFIPVIGAAAAGAALLAQQIDGVFFTGSYATGRRIAQTVAPRLIPLQLELGGKDPAYVCDDVDLEAAAEALVEGAFYNAGQSCCAVERIYVHRNIAAEFIAAFVGRTSCLRTGDPTDEATDVGPLARRAQLEVLEQQVADAVRSGARVEAGGERIAGRGYFFAPTVLTGVHHRMAVMREESFGPIIGIQEVADDAEALTLMNDTEYGLTAAVYTPDRERAERLLARVSTGTVYWNCCDRVSPRLPWSGRGHSGLGTTLSLAGIRAFVRPRAWHLRGPQTIATAAGVQTLQGVSRGGLSSHQENEMRGNEAMEKAKNALRKGKNAALQAGELVTDVIASGLSTAGQVGKEIARRASKKQPRTAATSPRRPSRTTARKKSQARKAAPRLQKGRKRTRKATARRGQRS